MGIISYPNILNMRILDPLSRSPIKDDPNKSVGNSPPGNLGESFLRYLRIPSLEYVS